MQTDETKEDEKPKPLTRKQQVFVAEYVQCWSASAAARRAGYSEKTAGQIGSRLLKKVEIKEAINTYLADIQMSADEAKTRLTEIGRGYLGMFFKVSEIWMVDPPPFCEIVGEKKEIDPDSDPPADRTVYLVRRAVLDMGKVVDPKYSRLLKKFSDTARGGTSIELYSAHEAHRDVLKINGEFKEKVELTGKDGNPLVNEDVIYDRIMAKIQKRMESNGAAGASDASEELEQ